MAAPMSAISAASPRLRRRRMAGRSRSSSRCPRSPPSSSTARSERAMPRRTTIDLAGQAALVTGASSGIGAAIAMGLAAAGAKVAVNYRSGPEAAQAVVEAIGAAGGEAFAVRADVSREEEVERMFAEAIERFGTLHILVANAGLQRDAPAHELSLADWNTVIGVNLTGQFLCCRAAIR